MSRVGKLPIKLPAGVKVTLHPDSVEFEGRLGRQSAPLYAGITASVEGETLVFARADEVQQTRALHGLCRALAQNALTGVAEGFVKKLEIVGVGYKAKTENGKLEINVGYSKPISYVIPEGVEITIEKATMLTIKGISKQKVGQVAHEIKSFRPPDPYKLKGIRYAGEKLIKKERKAGVAGA